MSRLMTRQKSDHAPGLHQITAPEETATRARRDPTLNHTR